MSKSKKRRNQATNREKLEMVVWWILQQGWGSDNVRKFCDRKEETVRGWVMYIIKNEIPDILKIVETFESGDAVRMIKALYDPALITSDEDGQILAVTINGRVAATTTQGGMDVYRAVKDLERGLLKI